MSNLRSKISQGQTLKKVRELEEKSAVAKMAQAQKQLSDSEENANSQRDRLSSMESEFGQATQRGLSMAEFMRFDSLKSMQVHALEQADEDTRTARKTLDAEVTQLRKAVTKRRVAERYVDILSSRWAVESKRKEQKDVDDLVCSRVGRVLH